MPAFQNVNAYLRQCIALKKAQPRLGAVNIVPV